MPVTRESFERWIDETIRPRSPELEPALRSAQDAFEAIRSSVGDRLGQEWLLPILTIAKSNQRPEYEYGAQILEVLTEDFDEARAAVLEMSRDRKAQVRFNAIISLGAETSREFSVSLIRSALRDGSSRVRGKAADWALRLSLSEIVPDLERQLDVEDHEKTKQTQDFSLKLLRDGYILKPASDIGYYITAPKKGGISSRYVSPAELEENGVEQIVREIQQREW